MHPKCFTIPFSSGVMGGKKPVDSCFCSSAILQPSPVNLTSHRLIKSTGKNVDISDIKNTFCLIEIPDASILPARSSQSNLDQRPITSL